MRRFRWFSLELPAGFEAFCARIRQNRWERDSDQWIQVSDGLQDEEYSFFWSSFVSLRSIDENGETRSELVRTLHRVEFSLFEREDHVILRIADPPRSIKPLMNLLESIAGFGFVSKGIEFDARVSRAVSEEFDSCLLIGLKVVNVVAGPDLVGRMEFASKSGMRASEIPPLKGLKYREDYSAFDISHRGYRGYVAFHSNGLAKIGGQLGPDILRVVEDGFAR